MLETGILSLTGLYCLLHVLQGLFFAFCSAFLGRGIGSLYAVVNKRSHLNLQIMAMCAKVALYLC